MVTEFSLKLVLKAFNTKKQVIIVIFCVTVSVFSDIKLSSNSVKILEYCIFKASTCFLGEKVLELRKRETEKSWGTRKKEGLRLYFPK